MKCIDPSMHIKLPADLYAPWALIYEANTWSYPGWICSGFDDWKEILARKPRN